MLNKSGRLKPKRNATPSVEHKIGAKPASKMRQHVCTKALTQ